MRSVAAVESLLFKLGARFTSRLMGAARFFSLQALAGLITLLCACNADSQETNIVQPETGVIVGLTIPNNAVATVTATRDGALTTSTSPDKSGFYSLSSLVAGTYTVAYRPAPGYFSKDSQQVVVKADSIIVMPILHGNNSVAEKP